MKYLITIPIVFLLAGCNPPDVDNCILDLNVLSAGIKELPANYTDVDIQKMLDTETVEYCVPTDTSKVPYSRPMKTGDHVFSAEEWGVLYRWIEDNKK